MITVIIYLLGVIIALFCLACLHRSGYSKDDFPIGLAIFSWIVPILSIGLPILGLTAFLIEKLFTPLYNLIYKCIG